jgi:hypothetical protein
MVVRGSPAALAVMVLIILVDRLPSPGPLLAVPLLVPPCPLLLPLPLLTVLVLLPMVMIVVPVVVVVS